MSKTASTGATLEQLRAQTEQLRAEASISRTKVSDCSKNLMEHCEKYKTQDMLVSGLVDGSHNPFQEKKSCEIL